MASFADDIKYSLYSGLASEYDLHMNLRLQQVVIGLGICCRKISCRYWTCNYNNILKKIKIVQQFIFRAYFELVFVLRNLTTYEYLIQTSVKDHLYLKANVFKEKSTASS